MRVWFADLAYNQQAVSNDTMPYPIALIASYLRATTPGVEETRIFKFPQELNEAYKKNQPEVIGFSNYMWNSNLCLSFARAIKKKYPHTITVMGGPNLPINHDELETYFRDHPEIDFWIIKEGEIGCSKLVQALAKIDFRKDKFLNENEEIPNLSYIDSKGFFRAPGSIQRVKDLDATPSPYINGDLDKYLDGSLMPIVTTNRGCPFTCTFCTEGIKEWGKIVKREKSGLRDELIYIAEKFNKLPKGTGRSDLIVSDANFGMYPDENETFNIFAEVQKKYDFPKFLIVTTGKNQKERILNAAKLLNGAIQISGAVQSLDPEVQKNIKRTNISTDQIVELALKSTAINTTTYSEVILALPGDTKKAHFHTLQTLIEAGFSLMQLYQLILLPGTEMASQESKSKFGLKGRYRITPRCFGYFEFQGEEIVSAEIEEVCVANNTLPFEDYLECRKMNLICSIFYNHGVFLEVTQFLTSLNLSSWGWIKTIYDNQTSDEKFVELLSNFMNDTVSELWVDSKKLRQFVNSRENVQKYLDGDLGNNLLFTYKSLSLVKYFSSVKKVALKSLDEYLEKMKAAGDVREIAQEIGTYCTCKAEDLFDWNFPSKTQSFKYDVQKAIKNIQHNLKPTFIKHEVPQTLSFQHSEQQKDFILGYKNICGGDLFGVTRIVSRTQHEKLYRKIIAPTAVMQGH
jgi:radical SAM superfamily enzyme YgiQ (UPF0313 family)